jgi:DNA-binding phage protein
MTKAELARRIAAKPEIIRRLFTSASANPTVTTVVAVARALGMRLALVSDRAAASNKRAATG